MSKGVGITVAYLISLGMSLVRLGAESIFAMLLQTEFQGMLTGMNDDRTR